MNHPPRPPRAARFLLGKALPADVRDNVLGDQEELFRERHARRGLRRARFWYWTSALELAVRFLVERAAERSRAVGSGFSLLDVKLGARMLVKYPGITVAGGLGMTVAIGLGVGVFDVSGDLFRPRLPLEEGERVVGIQSWDAAAGRVERRALHDFRRWEAEGLESIKELAAFRTIARNLIHPDGRAEPIRIAEITASGFQVARVPPLFGRPLVAADERPGAPGVVVIGHQMWQTRFEGEPDILGSTVQLGEGRYTIVGVMPPEFGFPINHKAWLPLSAEALPGPGDGPSIFIFGRLRPGIALAQAQAELERRGRIAAAESPATHARLRPRVVRYTDQFNDLNGRAASAMRLLFTVIVLVPCANVAILVYARTVTRRGEIAVRSALGASRGRIVTQAFVEVLVLAGLSAAMGLGAAKWGLRPINAMFGQGADGLPFWWKPGLSGSTIVYAAGLTVLAALLAGVLPALRLTGPRLQSSLRQFGAGGASIRLGRVWTGVIVAQVALSVVFLPPVLDEAIEGLQYLTVESEFEAENYLSARVVLDGPGTDEESDERSASEARFGDVVGELIRRLGREPGVAGVTFGSRLPGQEQPKAAIEVEGRAARSGDAMVDEVRTLSVATDFFDVLGAPVLAGRGFGAGDAGPDANVVLVSRSFVASIVEGGNAVGRRLRYATPDGESSGMWYEIVGVVGDLAPNPINPGDVEARVYHPASLESLQGLSLMVRVRPASETLGPRLRAIAAGIDPGLRLYDVLKLDEIARLERRGLQVFYTALGLAALSVVLLTTMGAYALMSFTVAQRRREIGIRAALGAEPRRLLLSIFSRALRQLALGAVVGFALALGLHAAAPQGLFMPERGPFLLLAVAALMIGIGAIATIGPARRGLAIQPSEALGEG